ncbi:YggT family protein [bacterium]|nr:YggT family protein [bacterium]
MISYAISIIFKIVYFILIFGILTSWIPLFDEKKDPIKTVLKINDAILAPFRAIIPPIGGVLDISPIAAFILLQIAENCFYRILIPMGL